jgi:streptogramin lyase
MRRYALNSFLALAFLVTGAAASHAEKLPANVRVAAEFPSGTFLENLHVAADGSVLFTSYLAREIGVLGKDGKTRVFTRLLVHPVGITAVNGGYLVTAHGMPFTAGQEFTKTQQVMLLDEQGKEIGNLPAPQALFLNGVMRLDDNIVLAADSLAATIWRIDVSARTITPWLSDPTLSRNAEEKQFRPGANGLKRVGDRLYISNSSRGTLSFVRIGGDGKPEGGLKAFAETGPIDDFMVEESGAVVYTTHGNKLVGLSPGGARSDVMVSGCGGCTAVARVKPDDPASDLMVLTTGGLLEGGKEPARILVVPR